MKQYPLDLLEYSFLPDSIKTLRYLFDTLNDPGVNAANVVRLKQTYLSIVEQEQTRRNTPIANSPDGMNFIYRLMDPGCYLLLTPYGIIPLVKNFLISEGELGLDNIKWMEEDHLLTYDLFYIVHNQRQIGVCHYSHDGNAFAYLTTEKRDPLYPFCWDNSSSWL